MGGKPKEVSHHGNLDGISTLSYNPIARDNNKGTIGQKYRDYLKHKNLEKDKEQ